MDKRESLLLNSQFTVVMGVLAYSFTKVSNISDSYELETINEGGLNGCPVFLKKQKNKAEVLVLERGVQRGVPLVTYPVLGAGSHLVAVTILVMNRGKPAKAYFFEKGVVTKWEVSPLDAMGKDVLIEKVEITHSGLSEVPIP